MASLAGRLGLLASPAWAGFSAALVAVAALAQRGAVAGILAGALAEELVFRGLLQGEMERWGWSRGLAALLSAVLFALAHAAAGQGLPGLLTFFPGLGFALLRARSRSVWPAVAAHAAANGLWRLGLGA